MSEPRRALCALALAAIVIAAAGCGDDSNVLGDLGDGNVRLVVTTDMALAGSVSGGSGHDDGEDDGDGSDDGSGGPGPGRAIVGVEIRLSDVEARSATLQQLTDVSLDLPVTVDLVALREGGGSVELAIGSLPPDTYDQLIVVISALILTSRDDVRITIEPPGGGWTVDLPTAPFEVVDGAVTTIELQIRRASFRFDFDADLDDIGADDFDPSFDIEIDD